MAKTDSFFIRKSLNIDNTSAFFQDSIDLGAYVDALGKHVLRIKNIAVSWTDSNARTPDINGNAAASADFQLTTQSQAGMVMPGDNRSVVASGRLTAFRGIGGVGVPGTATEALDNAPQHWSNGYLVGVDTMYLGGAATTLWNEDVYVSLVMECVSESLTKEAAMALALSQS